MLGFLYLQTTAQHDLTGSANPRSACEWGCMWVQGWATLQQSQSLCSCSVLSLLSHAVCSVQSFTPSNAATIPLTFPDRWRRGPWRPRFRSSDTCAAEIWSRRLRLSTPCRKGPWRSRNAGRFLSRERLSSSAWCRPRPAAAPACRFWSRSGGRSSSPPNNQTSADKHRPRALVEEVKKKWQLVVNQQTVHLQTM